MNFNGAHLANIEMASHYFGCVKSNWKILMKIYRLKKFLKFANREKISDGALIAIICGAHKGRIKIDLGSSVIKHKMHHPTPGRTGQIRLIFAFQATKQNSFFIDGFSKNEKENLTLVEEKAIRKIAKYHLELSQVELAKFIASGDIK